MKFADFQRYRMPVGEIIVADYPSLKQLALAGEKVGVCLRHRWSHRYLPRGPVRQAAFYESDFGYPPEGDRNGRSLPRDFNRLFVVNDHSGDPRVTAIPIGTQGRRHPWRFALAPLGTRRTKLAYCNFSLGTPKDPPYTAKRRKTYETVKHHDWITFENMGNQWGTYDLGLTTYYRHVAEHRFVLSPQGAGPDCYRTWEAMYLKAIPIVQRSPEMEHFADLPILFTDDYSELTPAYLKEQYERICETEYDFDLLRLSTWRRKYEDAVRAFGG